MSLGDLSDPLDDRQARTLGRVDVLLLPASGPAATIGLAETEDVCRQLDPRVIMPIHFKTAKCSFPKYTADDFTRGKSNVAVMPGSELVIEKEALPKSPQVFVLEHAL